MEVLRNFGLCAVQMISHNNKKLVLIHHGTELVFCFHLGDFVKNEKKFSEHYLIVTEEIKKTIESLTFQELVKIRKAPCYELYPINIRLEIYVAYLKKYIKEKPWLKLKKEE